jgi:hypothetical protein
VYFDGHWKKWNGSDEGKSGQDFRRIAGRQVKIDKCFNIMIFQHLPIRYQLKIFYDRKQRLDQCKAL